MSRIRPAQPTPAGGIRGILCPYCGHTSSNPKRCDRCSGFFDPLSRQATQNAMGPWFIRDLTNPTRPGCSFETLRELVKRGKVTRETVLRGPTTRQFWNFAARTPSVANLLGLCHNCHAEVSPDAYACQSCGAVFSPETDRQHMGLAPVHLLPGQAAPEIIAAASIAPPASVDRPPDPPMPSPARPGSRARATEAHPHEGGRSGVWVIAGVAIFLLAVAAGGILLVLKPWEHPAPGPARPVPSTPSAVPATGPASAPTPSESPKSPESVPPTPPPAQQPQPASPAPTHPDAAAPKPFASKILPLLFREPPDERGAKALIAGLPEPDARAWSDFVRRRTELARLRRLP